MRRLRRVPEVVQTSAMDCGPAALASLLAGHGIPVSYERLREACQTSVDGTSIDTLEETARALGLDARQILVPPDFVECPEAELLPALVVARHAEGLPHFVVAWRRRGARLEVMDPASGRRSPRARAFADELWRHSAEIPAEAWRRWAAGESYGRVLAARLARLARGRGPARRVLEHALQDPSWRSLAALEAAERMVRSLCERRALARGRAALRLVEVLLERVLAEPARALAVIPFRWWSVRPIVEPDGSERRLVLRGAVLVRVRGAAPRRADTPGAAALAPELAALVGGARRGDTARALLASVLEGGARSPGLLAAGAVLAAGAAVLQALVLRALLELPGMLALSVQRAAAFALAASFLAAQLLLELPLAALALRLGRALETRLRLCFQQAIPRLPERYFASRPVSDMAERAHSLSLSRALPGVCARAWRFLAQMLLAAFGLAWLDPALAVPALLLVGVSSVGPLLAQRLLAERELRARTHRGALARVLLDALLGLVPLRAHRAERALEREHERLLARWREASLRQRAAATVLDALLGALSFALAIWIVLGHVARGGEPAGLLLVGWWALWLPELGRELAAALAELPAQRNAAARVLAPLGALDAQRATPAAPPARDARDPEREPAPHFPELRSALRAAGAASATASAREPREGKAGPRSAPALAFPRAPRIALHELSVRALGREILSGLELELEPGEHVALVGASGAGKSSLLALLLGLHGPAAGSLLVDGKPLDEELLAALRRRTAWVDPAVQLWNASLADNLRYGGTTRWEGVADALRRARLETLVERLTGGLACVLGEGGGLVSGGEGQRVRLARALAREDVRLALLDEPFRGLDRATRTELYAQARERWRDATLVCATHDLADTESFERVLVLEEGRLVEDGAPRALAADPRSSYARLLARGREAREALERAPGWRRLVLEDGRLRELPREEAR